MRRRLTEGSVIFVSVFKWFILATGVGALVGAATYVFLEILKWSFSFGVANPYHFLWLPLALFLSALIIEYVSPEAGGYGTEKVIEAVHKNFGRVRALVVPAKLVATVLTLSAGGSVGKVGPSAQIGAGLSSMLADIVGFNDTDRKKLVICGISAGFASVFGAPIAGAIFAVEVLFVGAIMYDVLLPSFVAGIVGYQVASSLGVTYLQHSVDFTPVFTESFFIIVALSGVFFGLCSFLLIETMVWGKRFASRMEIWRPLKGLIGGALLVVIGIVFTRDVLGLGEGVIQTAISGGEVPWYAFFLKIVTTVITFNAGGTGGIITPILFIGATAGAFFAMVFGLSTATFSAIGFVSLLAGAANTPITGSILAVEVFGPEIGPYAAVACIISFLMTGHRSIFPSQLMAMKKSASFAFELGKDVDSTEARFEKRRKSLIDVLSRIKKRVEVKNYWPEPGPEKDKGPGPEKEPEPKKYPEKYKDKGAEGAPEPVKAAEPAKPAQEALPEVPPKENHPKENHPKGNPLPETPPKGKTGVGEGSEDK